MGLGGICERTVSKLCKDIDDRVGQFLNRPLAGDRPCVRPDATYLKQRQGGRIVWVAVMIAVAANTEGRRKINGLGFGPSNAFARLARPRGPGDDGRPRGGAAAGPRPRRLRGRAGLAAATPGRARTLCCRAR
jgi:hypothetical protein